MKRISGIKSKGLELPESRALGISPKPENPRCSMELVYLPTKLGSFGGKCRSFNMGVSKNSGTPKWMVYFMENPYEQMDDLGCLPLFLETPI